MKTTKELRKEIFKKTDGRCHLCKMDLIFKNYGQFDEEGSWEIDHSVPVSKGGTDHMNNLFPACITCNREKKTHSSKTVRAWNGLTKAPLSRDMRERIIEDNKAKGLGLGIFVGGVLFGPLGAVLAGIAGMFIAEDIDPED